VYGGTSHLIWDSPS